MLRIVIDYLLKLQLNPPPPRPYYQCTYMLWPINGTPFRIQLISVFDRQNRRRKDYAIYLN